MSFISPSVSNASDMSDGVNDTTVVKIEKKNSFFKGFMKPIKWIGRNWSAYDPKYSTPSFYMWVGQLQNTFSQEWLNMSTSDGFDVKMSSKLSSRIGPHLGYSFLIYGFTFDLNALKDKSKRRNEFTLSINSNLLNIDLIWRRTGGDFSINSVKSPTADGLLDSEQSTDLTQLAKIYSSQFPDLIKYDVTGININYFVNHKKYSNPAAFSNGAIQIRSVGSPIVGFGYTGQKVTTELSDVFVEAGIDKIYNSMSSVSQQELLAELNKTNFGSNIKNMNQFTDLLDSYWDSGNLFMYRQNFKTLYNNPAIQRSLFGAKMSDGVHVNNGYMASFANFVPSITTIDDWHLQLGYAYNLVFSRRLLFGVSLIASPGIKRVHYDNSRSIANITGEELAEAYSKYNDLPSGTVTADDFVLDETYTNFGVNVFGRASLTYNHNRWRAGVNFNANAFLYNSKDLTVNNVYGSAAVYVGYCFGRKKRYRYDGKDRQAYITYALTKKQIEEMKDTMPKSNVDKGVSYLGEYKKTKYHSDNFNFDIFGCDLVKGPDGKYGTFEIEDGFVTPGQDTEGRVSIGKVFDIDKYGDFSVSVGHKVSFLTGNWWKSQLDRRQLPTNWYPEMLFYALKGKLTLYVRSHTFGTKKPVKMVIDDFYISRGTEARPFVQIGAKSFYSHSAYSIIGTADVNNRLCRVYIESKKRGMRNMIYINRMKASSMMWMNGLPDDRPISRVSIPGTHDAGTASLPEGSLTSMSHTQNFTVTEQLQDGIRAFDIRLKKNMKYGHTLTCRDGFDESLEDIRAFLHDNPSEFIVAMIGSDEGGKWSDEMIQNYNKLIDQYKDLFIEDFDAQTAIKDVRGKILVIKRQEKCPFGKLLKFADNAVFDYDCFRVEDVYREHKTYKKIKIVENHLREAYENDDHTKWFITFNSIAWDPRHHKPYYSTWGAVNVRKPMNPSLQEMIESKGYSKLGLVFLDFYNDHGDKPRLVESIINSNFHIDIEKDYILVK